MTKRYRLTPIDPSNGPHSLKEFDNQTNHNQHQQSPPDAGHRTSAEDQSAVQQSGAAQKSSKRWRWGLLGFVAAVLIMGAMWWMSDVSSSLSHLNQTTQQNAHSLARENTRLTVIQSHMQVISQQLSQISQQIAVFFGHLMQAISSKL